MSGSGIALSLKGLTKRFGPVTAVNQLSLDVRDGEILGLLGPNGAGKTTTINLICGLLQPDGGSVEVMGQRLADHRHLRRQLGLCAQENVFWPRLTCGEQLVFIGEMYGLSRAEAARRSTRLLDWLGLSEKADALAHTLSGGMKRRLSLCLALVHEPALLVLDEPEAGLDPQSRILVRERIRDLSTRCTILLSTHNMDEADRLSNRVAVIDHGKLLKLGTSEELKRLIGPGDVLELELDRTTGVPNDVLTGLQEGPFSHVHARGNTIFLHAPHIVEHVGTVTRKVNEKGLEIREIRLRQNTLEDVFIALTGRSLRS